MRQSLTLSLPTVDATDALGDSLARALGDVAAGWTVLLEGELGAGKSTLARAMLHAWGHVGSVPSPTYTLVEPYDVPNVTVYHIDLYRISDAEELEFLGWSDLDDGLKLIEWPERVPSVADSADLRIELAYDPAGGSPGREATITALSARGEDCLSRIPGLASESP